MIAIVATNLRRRLARTLLTAAGIAVGVATIVALLSFTQGLRESAANFVHLGGSDLGVFQADVADPTASVLPQAMVSRLKDSPGITDATPLLLMIEAIEGEPAAVAFGAEPQGFFSKQLVIVSGSRPRAPGRTTSASSSQAATHAATPAAATGAPQVLVGDKLAARRSLHVGGTLKIEGRPFEIAGVYHSGIPFEDSGAILDLRQAQALTGRQGEETNVVVRLSAGTKAKQAAAAIERRFPGTQAISEPQQALRAGANGLLISKAVLVIVVIALIVGIIGVANTMAMAISERQAEFGLLSTVGWSPARVAGLVLGEGVAVSVIGAAGGLLLGVIGSDLLVRALGVSGYVSPSVTAWGLGRGLLVGVAIGVLGGIYPAWRVTRMTPLKALSGT